MAARAAVADAAAVLQIQSHKRRYSFTKSTAQRGEYIYKSQETQKLHSNIG